MPFVEAQQVCVGRGKCRQPPLLEFFWKEYIIGELHLSLHPERIALGARQEFAPDHVVMAARQGRGPGVRRIHRLEEIK
jgi:hypothetical protein